MLSISTAVETGLVIQRESTASTPRQEYEPAQSTASAVVVEQPLDLDGHLPASPSSAGTKPAKKARPLRGRRRAPGHPPGHFRRLHHQPFAPRRALAPALKCRIRPQPGVDVARRTCRDRLGQILRQRRGRTGDTEPRNQIHESLAPLRAATLSRRRLRGWGDQPDQIETAAPEPRIRPRDRLPAGRSVRIKPATPSAPASARKRSTP